MALWCLGNCLVVVMCTCAFMSWNLFAQLLLQELRMCWKPGLGPDCQLHLSREVERALGESGGLAACQLSGWGKSLSPWQLSHH